MGTDQLKELKRLQKENERLRKAVSDLALDNLILAEAARGNFQTPRVAGNALTFHLLERLRSRLFACRIPQISWSTDHDQEAVIVANE